MHVLAIWKRSRSLVQTSFAVGNFARQSSGSTEIVNSDTEAHPPPTGVDATVSGQISSKLKASKRVSKYTSWLEALGGSPLYKSSDWKPTIQKDYLYRNNKGDLLSLLRRYNFSLPNLVGQVIIVKVLRITEVDVYVDTGFYGISPLPKDDVNPGHLYQKVQEKSSVNVVEPGDLILCRIVELFTPYGDMELKPYQAGTDTRRKEVWTGIVKAHENGNSVSGRVLNQTSGGFSVGIAGYVAMMPYAMCSSSTTNEVGHLQNFWIYKLDLEKKLIFVTDGTRRK